LRAVVQRVRSASVRSDGEVLGAIGHGLLVLLGVGLGDDEGCADYLAGRVAALRVFEDDAGKMNLGAAETAGAVLCVSQFTLYGDLRGGNRPSFTGAAAPALAERLYDRFCAGIEAAGLRCERGRFGAQMEVELVNDGPVTLLLDSDDLRRPRRA
jgi:D-tyrosyl-tRNA(Tyr) deacylase